MNGHFEFSSRTAKQTVPSKRFSVCLSVFHSFFLSFFLLSFRECPGASEFSKGCQKLPSRLGAFPKFPRDPRMSRIIKEVLEAFGSVHEVRGASRSFRSAEKLPRLQRAFGTLQHIPGAPNCLWAYLKVTQILEELQRASRVTRFPRVSRRVQALHLRWSGTGSGVVWRAVSPSRGCPYAKL